MGTGSPHRGLITGPAWLLGVPVKRWPRVLVSCGLSTQMSAVRLLPKQTVSLPLFYLYNEEHKTKFSIISTRAEDLTLTDLDLTKEVKSCNFTGFCNFNVMCGRGRCRIQDE